MKVIRRTPAALLNLVLLFSMTLALAAPGLSQGPGGDDGVLPSTAAPQALERSESRAAPVSTPAPIDCKKPLPGWVAKVVDNDEIMLLYAGLGSPIHIVKLDNKSDGSKDLVDYWDWPYHPYTGAGISTADLVGDTTAEVVMAFTTGGLREGELGAVSLTNPDVDDKSLLVVDSWTSSSDGRWGYFGPIGVAAGNLDGSLTGGDKADEVVLAFQDADHRLQIILLDGESDGGIKYLTSWVNTDHGRSYILSPIAVDVGDVDSNGYDDDIVLAFVDKDQDIQVVVLKLNQQGGVTLTGWDYWTNDDRGDIDWKSGRLSIDVATGDFNGDYTDEIAVAFRDGTSALQVMQVVYDPNASTPQGRVSSPGWWRDTSHYRNDVASVSVTAGDIDGDKNEEIISAFADGRNHLGLVTLDAESAKPKLRGSYGSAAGELSSVYFTTVAAGDLDARGQVEVVVSFADHDFDVQVVSFNDNPDCPCNDDATSGLIRRDGWTKTGGLSDPLAPFGISLGDVNGDSVYGDYQKVCTGTVEVRMTALVGRPPYWEDLNKKGSEVGYGKSSGSEKESEQEVTTSYGSSVTYDLSFMTHGIEFGPSMTQDWENSISTSTTTGTKIKTSDGWAEKEDGLVPLDGVTFYSYQYKRRDNGAPARVGVPVHAATDAKSISYWMEPKGMRADAPTSWVPAYRSGWMDKVGIPGSFGASNQGAGADYYDINGKDTPDYLFAWIDNPSGENTINYRIGWDPAADGKPVSWSATYQVDPDSGGIGWEPSGLGAAITELNGNSTPELVVAWVANPEGNNWAAYKIGWDLNSEGQATSWSGKKVIPGWVGGSTQGVGLDIAQFGGDARPEMFFGWIDNPKDVNDGWYRVGWNLDANGDTDDWWTYPKHIEGAFGPENQGLGLTLADMDSSDYPELIAAWVRHHETGNEWAYSVGEEMDGNAYVGSWVPGHAVAGWVGDSTDFAALASSDVVTKTGKPELVVGWIDNPSGDNAAYLRVGQYWPLGGDPDMYPTDVVTSTTDGEFKMNLYDQWWNVSGDLTWRWDEYMTDISVSKGGTTAITWSVDHTDFTEHTTGTSKSYNIEVGWEAEFMGVGVEGSTSYGFEDGSSQSISWEKGWYMEGQTSGLPDTASHDQEYQYFPFTYMQEAMSIDGARQAYMVLDYVVPYIGPLPLATEASASPALRAAFAGVTPEIPLIASPSHPDPDTWYPTGTVVFTWTQPDGDPAVVDGYRWYLDRHPDTIPSEFSQGLTDTTTYEDFSDGLWYFHLRARGDGGDWSETAHRAVRLDAHPTQVEIIPDPALPIDNGGWYNTPVTVSINADDSSTSSGQTGSGVQSVEISTDGVAWQPYTDPLVFATDTPHITLWARATDMVGHTSEPVSTTFGLDVSAPVSVEGSGCWKAGGDCEAGVITDVAGNQRLRLSGQLDGSLSGVKGLRIEINGQRWTSADETGSGHWSFTSDTELGAGCHTFNIQGEDRAGNVEALHPFGAEVVWHPRQRPDLSGSRISVAPKQVRPGDTVTFTLAVPNSGWQETWVPISTTLPPGLHVLPDSISGDGAYDDATRTVTWPPRYLWPGEQRRLTFDVQVDAGLGATTLDVSLTALGTWPIVDTCPADALPGFRDLETTVERTTTLVVDPTLPDGADTRPPDSPFLRVEDGITTNNRQVQLRIYAGTDAAASADAVWMYLREWTLSATTGAWAVAQESGWLPYRPSYPWNLSQGDGVKYLGVWLADGAGNVSVLDSSSLVFTNLLESRQSLPDGQRIQYRFPLRARELAVFNLVSQAGNADLYVWQPRNGWRPDYAANGTGTVDVVGFWAAEGGVYLVEAKAEGDAVYQLLLAGDVAPRAPTQWDANAPDHPLTVSDPLSAGAGVAPAPPEFPKLYLPIVRKNG